jgi:hypothetical protein
MRTTGLQIRILLFSLLGFKMPTNKKFVFICSLLTGTVRYFSTFSAFFKEKKSQNWGNQSFSTKFCFFVDGRVRSRISSRSSTHTVNYISGSWRPTAFRIRNQIRLSEVRIRIRTKISRIPQDCLQEHYCAGCGAEHLSKLREDLQGDSRADL